MSFISTSFFRDCLGNRLRKLKCDLLNLEELRINLKSGKGLNGVLLPTIMCIRKLKIETCSWRTR